MNLGCSVIIQWRKSLFDPKLMFCGSFVLIESFDVKRQNINQISPQKNTLHKSEELTCISWSEVRV